MHFRQPFTLWTFCLTSKLIFFPLLDINECKQNNPCSYQCLNRYGSYECVCPDGTMLGDDQRTCEGKHLCEIFLPWLFLFICSGIGFFKRQSLILVVVKDQYSHLGVSNYMHIMTNLWKFWLNWSSKLWENNEQENLPHCIKLMAFRCQRKASCLKPWDSILWLENTLSLKLHYFKGCRFMVSIALQCSLPVKFVIVISLSYYQMCTWCTLPLKLHCRNIKAVKIPSHVNWLWLNPSWPFP